MDNKHILEAAKILNNQKVDSDHRIIFINGRFVEIDNRFPVTRPRKRKVLTRTANYDS